MWGKSGQGGEREMRARDEGRGGEGGGERE